MKNFAKLMIIYFGIFWFLNTSAFEDYNEYKNNQQRAIFIENYLNSHKKQIQNFTKKYNVESDIQIKNEIYNIDLLIKSLKLIQEKNIDSQKEKQLINTIVDEIKKINDKLKILLQQRKDSAALKLEESIQNYWHLWIKLSVEINKLTKSFESIQKKETYMLSRKETNIKESLNRLNELSYLLKMFWKLNFSSENDVKTAFKKTIIEIRNQMNIIKQNI